MRIFLGLVALLGMACTDEVATDEEIHEQVSCEDWGGFRGAAGYDQCDAPCVSLGDLGSRAACTANGQACPAGMFSDWNGRQGCCVPSDERPIASVAFVECD
jgi:hypothetical protein